MKNFSSRFMSLFALALSLATTQAQAHEIKALRQADNSVMQTALDSARALAKAMKKTAYRGDSPVLRAYDVISITPKRKNGRIVEESPIASLLRVLRFSLHRDYPITGDEEGYSFTEIDSSKHINAAFLDTDHTTELKAFQAALDKAIERDGIRVYSGNGSGNNTYAAIEVVIDVKNRQYFYLMDSNFGSDD